jgi:ABC-type proline/glycine betaine transport system permease subunit
MVVVYSSRPIKAANPAQSVVLRQQSFVVLFCYVVTVVMLALIPAAIAGMPAAIAAARTRTGTVRMLTAFAS